MDRAFDFALRTGEDVVAVRCIASPAARRPGVVVCVNTFSLGPDSLAELRADLKVQ